MEHTSRRMIPCDLNHWRWRFAYLCCHFSQRLSIRADEILLFKEKSSAAQDIEIRTIRSTNKEYRIFTLDVPVGYIYLSKAHQTLQQKTKRRASSKTLSTLSKRLQVSRPVKAGCKRFICDVGESHDMTVSRHVIPAQKLVEPRPR